MSSTNLTTYGPGGFNTGKPANNVVSTVAVADTPEYLAAGLASSNTDVLVSKARAAITANANYLAIPAPSNAQVVAQVERLTRECSALIRILVGADLLVDTAGT